jgi:transposase-like protein
MDETYIKVKRVGRYFYSAVDKNGQKLIFAYKAQAKNEYFKCSNKGNRK